MVMAPEYILMPHHAHSFIVNVQPAFPTTAVSVRVEHVDSIVSAASGLAVVEKHAIQLVSRRLHRLPSNRCRDFWTDRAVRNLNLSPL
jgi:hypothetical protein